MAELLLELLSEEIPARMQARACADLERLIAAALDGAGLGHDAVMAYATPRRLAVHVTGLPPAQADIKEERRGPRVDAGPQAIAGFLKSVGLPREALEERAEKKGRFLYAVVERKGRPTALVLADILPGVIRAFPWPKSMRWGDGALRWVRPLTAILCLFDGAVVPFALDGMVAGGATRGHRFMAPGVFEVKDFADYRAKLEEAYVLLDPEARKGQIRKEAKALAVVSKLALWEDEALIAENAGLTEWPVVLMGAFDSSFLEVPGEVLSATMGKNQKYFTLLDPQSRGLANRFLCVANIEAQDGGRAIIKGNEKVLAARLADAQYFWRGDLKIKLQDRLPKLADIVFHEKLGTVADKAERMAALARHLAPFCNADPDLAERAARLAKADLVSAMVGEFPELQGIMGGYYARHQGEDAGLAQAIEEHYAPKGPEDACPTAPLSLAVALADKLDTLVGFFSIDERPTGSKDPYALRRAALGVIRLIVENNIRIELNELIKKVSSIIYEAKIDNLVGALPVEIDDFNIVKQALLQRGGEAIEWISNNNIRDIRIAGVPISINEDLDSGFEEAFLFFDFEPSHLIDFFADRLKVQQRDKGVAHDHIDAVFSLGGEDDLVRLLKRVEALTGFLKTEDGANLLTGYRRAANIVRIEEKKDGRAYDGAVDAARLAAPEEVALFERLGAARGALEAAMKVEDFPQAMRALSALRGPLDAFFEGVTVNAEDAGLRQNRLNLLSQIRRVMHLVVDFAKIEG